MQKGNSAKQPPGVGYRAEGSRQDRVDVVNNAEASVGPGWSFR